MNRPVTERWTTVIGWPPIRILNNIVIRRAGARQARRVSASTSEKAPILRVSTIIAGRRHLCRAALWLAPRNWRGRLQQLSV